MSNVVEKLKKKQKEKSGAALAIAIVISMVLIVFSTTLVLAGYSLFRTVMNENVQLVCKEMTHSVLDSIEKDIIVDFSNYENQQGCRGAGDHMIWFYLRDNLWQTQDDYRNHWFYYNVDEEQSGHTLEHSMRYFTIAPKAGTGDAAITSAVDEVNISMYWECSQADYIVGILDADETIVHFTVEVNKNNESYRATRSYILRSVKPYDPEDYSGNELLYKWVWERYEI